MSDTQVHRADPDDYLPEDDAAIPAVAPSGIATPLPAGASSFEEALVKVIEFIRAKGYVVDPWQIAAYVTAVRTKPLVTIAGISGTGKSTMPRLIAQATEAVFQLEPVNPDWTDSGEVVGHTNLNDDFVPGSLMQMARQASENPDAQHFFMLDELNLARPEYYLAEVLSVIETRTRTAGGLETEPLKRNSGTDDADTDWSDIQLPPNLAIVGSVNMDETTFSFARKVLDRTFVLEFTDVDLENISTTSPTTSESWKSEDWEQPFLAIAEMGETDAAKKAIAILKDVNDILQPLQQHVGYRVRDDVAMFLENAQGCLNLFVTSDGERVDPLDLALFMKILPRIQGSSSTLAPALDSLLEVAAGENSLKRAFSLCQDRVELMKKRLHQDGFASYWV